MAAPQLLTKRMAIDKTGVRTVAIVAAASFVTIFCLVASRAVYSQNRYQARVTSAKQKALTQLQKNLSAFNSLSGSYNDFVNSPANVLGGNPAGSGQNDGDNSKIILDALPDSYDFPSLTSSIEKILTDHGFAVGSISGTDDQLNQQSNTTSVTPQPVTMPFSFTVNHANYTAISQLVATLQQSIRPISVDQLTLSGGVNDMTATVNAHTYYQPGVSLNIVKKAVK